MMTLSFGALCQDESQQPRVTRSIPTGREIGVKKCNFFTFPYVSKGFLMQKNDFFLKKSKKKVFFCPLVSDHVVTLNTITVRAHFFDFPIDFFLVLPPSLYADEVLCAASRAALPPHMLFVFRKNRKWRNSMQVGETLFLCNRYAPGRRIVMAVRFFLIFR